MSQATPRPAQSKNEQIKQPILDFFTAIGLSEAIQEQGNLINTYVCPSNDLGELEPSSLANTVFYSSQIVSLLTKLYEEVNRG